MYPALRKQTSHPRSYDNKRSHSFPTGHTADYYSLSTNQDNENYQYLPSHAAPEQHHTSQPLYMPPNQPPTYFKHNNINARFAFHIFLPPFPPFSQSPANSTSLLHDLPQEFQTSAQQALARERPLYLLPPA